MLAGQLDWKNTLRRTPFVRHAPFVLASAVVFALCNHIRLPFSNPWNITGVLARAHFNPANNILRFLIFVGAPLLLLGGLRFLPFTRNRYPWGETSVGSYDLSYQQTAVKRLLPILLLTFLACVILALNVPTHRAPGVATDPWGVSLDTFHDGESLGTSVSLMNGHAPYKDFVFAHGVFQDPLRSVVAFKLFNRSIGAVRTLDSIVKLLCFLVLFAFLLVLYNGRYLYAFLTLLVLFLALFCGALIIPARDLMTFSFLLATGVLVRAINEPEPKLSAVGCAALVFFSFLPLAAMVYSIDRGFYIIATYGVMLPLIVFWFRRRLRYRALAFSALGFGLGVMFVGLLLRWEFRAFLDFAILTLPRYKELIDGFVYPFRSPKYLLIVLIISWNAYWVFARFLTAYRPFITGAVEPGSLGAFLRMHLMDICMVLLSLCFFRSALGRSDWSHVEYSCSVVYILSCYLIVKYWLHGALKKRPDAGRMLTRYLVCITVAGCLLGILRIGYSHLLERNFPLKKTDAQFIPSDHQQGLAFLTANLSTEDKFFTMTSEASWYYLLNRPCPSRFPVVWFAEPPFYQQEIVRDLRINRVKIILYRNREWPSNIDGISASERLPIVDAYIRDNYRPFATVAGNEFWIRKM